MRQYEIDVHHKAARAILKLPQPDQAHIARKIDSLADDPRPADVEKLTDTRNGYRIRSGDYRIVYTVDDTILVVNIVRVAHRREVYRRM